MMKEEFVAVVDDDDNVIGKATVEEILRKGLIHRSANVIVFNSKGEIFIHKRNSTLMLYPGMHDIKFGGMVDYGESYEDAAKRELEEEAEINDVKLERLFRMKTRTSKNNCNRAVFKCVYDGKIKLDKNEVEEGRFMKVEEAVKMMKEGKLSPSAEQILREFLKRR